MAWRLDQRSITVALHLSIHKAWGFSGPQAQRPLCAGSSRPALSYCGCSTTTVSITNHAYDRRPSRLVHHAALCPRQNSGSMIRPRPSCRGGPNAGPRSGDVHDGKSAASGLPDEALYQNQRIGEFHPWGIVALARRSAMSSAPPDHTQQFSSIFGACDRHVLRCQVL
jgi:hypothetical protein